MGKILLFLRVSTIVQDLDSQENILRKAAKEDGKNEADFIVIGKKESAIKLKEEEREGIKELKNIIEKEDVDCVYITELSRLSRKPDILYHLRDYFLNKKVQLKCLSPSFTLLNKERTTIDQHTNLIFAIFGTLAEQEMIEKKERFARGKRQKAREGRFTGGRLPFGYKVIKEKNNIIEIDDNEAEIVRKIYNMYEKGYSQTRIAVELKQQGYIHPRHQAPQIIPLALINNILNNKCYTGETIEEKLIKVKNKISNKETQYMRYERSYPQIIPIEQFNKCRQLAEINRTSMGKGKNIYYATNLVKCQTCGCYWSANSSKATYHCYNALIPSKNWDANGRKKAQCKNKTTMSINVLDSLLWYIAKRAEASLLLTSKEEKIEELQKEIHTIQKKVENIPFRLERINKIIENLSIKNAEGLISDDTFEKKIKEKNIEKKQIINEKVTFDNKIDEINTTIQTLKKTMEQYVIHDPFWEVDNKGVFHYNEIYKSLGNIQNDKERYDIIHRNIKDVQIKNVIIDYKFKIGWRKAKAKKIIIDVVDWRWENEIRKYVIYYLPFNGKGNGIYLNQYNYGIKDNLWVDDEGKLFGMHLLYTYFHDYNKKAEVIYENDDKPHLVSIIDIPYINRYCDYGKKKKREREKEEAYKDVKAYYRVQDVARKYNIKQSQIYDAIYKGQLKANLIRHKLFISPQDADSYFSNFATSVSNNNDLMSASEIADRLNINYSKVLRRIKKGIIPNVHINGRYYINLQIAKDYFSKSY